MVEHTGSRKVDHSIRTGTSDLGNKANIGPIILSNIYFIIHVKLPSRVLPSPCNVEPFNLYQFIAHCLLLLHKVTATRRNYILSKMCTTSFLQTHTGVNSVNKHTSSGTAHLGESFLYNTEVICSSDWQIMFVINIFW